MIPITRQLPPTKTYAIRWYHAVAPALKSNNETCLARVYICQQPTARSRKIDENVYLLEQVIDESLPRGWQSFIFTNQSAEPTQDRPGQYQVNVDQHGQTVFCGCTGSTCQKQADVCKHRHVIRDLIEHPLPDPDDADAEYEGRLY